MSANSPIPPVERRLHTAQLSGLMARLHQVFTRHGIPFEKSAALIGNALSARCVKCGIDLRGEELFQLTAPTDANAPASPKLDRLRQGYCARTGCDSYFVNLVAQPAPDMDWSKAFAEAESEAVPDAAAPATPAKRAMSPQRRKLLRIAVGLALLLVAFIIRQLVTHRSIPFIYEPERFKADPSSLPAEPYPATPPK